MNEGEVKIAAGLAPIMKMLYRAGVLSFGACDNPTVHVTHKFFEEAFPEYDADEAFDGETFHYKHVAHYDGVEFYSLYE